MKRLATACLSIATLSAFAMAGNYPFPQNANYIYGNRVPYSTTDSAKVQQQYQMWLNSFYRENGSQARIQWTWGGTQADSNTTVSEGIGYGMLILVYMDNPKNSTQSKFDKLLAYYNAHLDGNGLMHWKISGWGGATGTGGATDADLDVALALLQASKQWGDGASDKYITAAKTVIAKLWQFDVNTGGNYLYSGDQWQNGPLNPSYFSTAAMKLFAKVDNSHAWASVATNSYAIIKKNRNASTGLVSDWCDASGNPQQGNAKEPGLFGYDAIRTPMRMALAYLWYGDADAKDIALKMATWANTKSSGDPNKLYLDGYRQDGTPYNSNNSNANTTMSGGLATAGLVDASTLGFAGKGYTGIAKGFIGDQDDNYYNYSLGTLYMLMMTGNMPNFWDPITHASTDTNATLLDPLTFTNTTVSAPGVTPVVGTTINARLSKKAYWKLTLKGATSGATYFISSTAVGGDSLISLTWDASMKKLTAFKPLETVTISIDNVWNAVAPPAASIKTITIGPNPTGIQDRFVKAGGLLWNGSVLRVNSAELIGDQDYEVRVLDMTGRVLRSEHQTARGVEGGVEFSMARPSVGSGLQLLEVRSATGLRVQSVLPLLAR